MPVLRNHSVVEFARGIKAFLSLDLGVTRGQARDRQILESQLQAQARKLAYLQEQSKKQSKRLEQSYKQIANKDRRLAALEQKLVRAEDGSENCANLIKPENIVWIFGTARTGSTWLSRMMGEMEGQTVWFEPHVGQLFGRLYYDWNEERHFRTKHFILSEQKDLWISSVRHFILEGATRRFPEAIEKRDYLTVKEPNGSIGAPLLAEALPESRMIFLMRDPRDVVASALDTFREGSWHYERTSETKRGRNAVFGGKPGEIVKERADAYLREMTNSKQAYECFEGRKVLVKYENLRLDTLENMKRIYSALEIIVDEGALARVVEKHSWENLPEGEKGQGKFHRKAAPGGWRDDLTAEQIEIVEEVTAPILNEFYPD